MEDWEKKYKEALERAKAGKPMDDVFPELKESEDERIRMDICTWLKHKQETCTYPTPKKEILSTWISYLEKQKNSQQKIVLDNPLSGETIYEREIPEFMKGPDPKDAEAIIHLTAKGWTVIAPGKEQKPAQTIEEKEYIRTLKSLISDFIRDKQPEDVAFYQKIYDWLDGRHIEQKPVGWDDYTKTNLDRALQIIKKAKGNLQGYQSDDGIYECDKAIECLEHFLYRGLEIEKPAEWSEEDERIMDNCIEFIKASCLDANYLYECIDWLKSLRGHSEIPNSHWKPSKEQMDWLESAVRLSTDKPRIHGTIISLYEQLKRLSI